MELTKKQQIFENHPIPKAVASLSIPTVLGALVMVFYSLADTYFVGLLNDPVQSSAVTLGAPVLLAFNAINNLFGVGGSSMMSRALGRKDYETLRRSASFSFYGSLIFAALFGLVCTVFRTPLLTMIGADSSTWEATSQYLNWTVTCGSIPAIVNVVLGYMIRSEGSALHASIGTMSGCFLNILLDPIFVLPWGFGMGAAGAALATFLSNCAALGYFFVYLFINRKTTCVCISPKAFCLRKNITGGVFAVGIPAAIQNLLNVTGMTILNNFAAPFGTQALAAMGICSRINMVPLNVFFGLSQGIMPLVSYNYASGNTNRMKQSLYFTRRLAVISCLVVAAIFFAFPQQMVRIFINDAGTIAYGSKFLRGFSLALPFMCVDFIAVNAFQAVGMGKESLLFAILRKIILEIPALFILNAIFPLYGLPYAQAIAEFVLAIAGSIVLANFIRKKEQKNSR